MQVQKGSLIRNIKNEEIAKELIKNHGYKEVKESKPEENKPKENKK